MFELKPDAETVIGRYDAWWNGAIVDRPLVSTVFAKPEAERRAVPQKHHATLRERWMDTDYVVARHVATLSNQVFFGDALPVAWPNLGPEVFSAFYGCELEFGDTTVWSRPILDDWSPASLDALALDTGSVYFRKLDEMTDALLAAAAGRFIVGYTDLHPGGDALAAFRDPQALLIDTIERPEEIGQLVERITDDFLRVYDHFHAKLSSAGMPSTTWAPATCRGRFHVPSNDFSCMISPEAFQRLFVPALARECRHMDRCLYHLDGPDALRHLDTLLELPEIHAIQWVPGARNKYWANWIDVYQRIQAKGKSMQILSVPLDDLDLLFESLAPEGVWISHLDGADTLPKAEAAMKKLAGWTKKR